MVYFGLDPGVRGGLAVLDAQRRPLLAVGMPTTDQDIWDVFERVRALSPVRAVLEQVHASPQMGVVSAFTFGGQYRALRAFLTAAQIPFTEATPQRWQRKMECFTEGDKNVTKVMAMQLFPGQKITHAIADSLLLAEFCRREHCSL